MIAPFVYDKNAGISAYNDAAHTYDADQITTLFMIHVPDSADQLDTLLATFKNLSNLFLLHSGRNQAEKLTVPSRDQFKLLYVLLMRMAAEPIREKEALLRLSQQSSATLRMVSMMMDVFEELSFIERRDGHIVVIPKPPKRELSSSAHFSALGSLAEMEQHLLYAGTSQCTSWMISRLEGAS
ncbi:hypothetical protein CM49_03054 [Paenibacillus sp. P1XP2]|nr:hypothetical protein CM49_03054 [Paenibacillus sp. P1XP2]